MMVFWDLSLGEAPVRLTERWRKWSLPQSHTTQSPNSQSAQTSTPSNLLLFRVRSQQGGATGSLEGGAIAFPHADAMRRRVLHPRNMVSGVWKMDSALGETLEAVSSTLFHEPQTPVSPHVIVVYSAFSPLECRLEWLQMRFWSLEL